MDPPINLSWDPFAYDTAPDPPASLRLCLCRVCVFVCVFVFVSIAVPVSASVSVSGSPSSDMKVAAVLSLVARTGSTIRRCQYRTAHSKPVAPYAGVSTGQRIASSWEDIVLTVLRRVRRLHTAYEQRALLAGTKISHVSTGLLKALDTTSVPSVRTCVGTAASARAL
eukprot:2363936-Rhodomonas_salina.1